MMTQESNTSVEPTLYYFMGKRSTTNSIQLNEVIRTVTVSFSQVAVTYSVEVPALQL